MNTCPGCKREINVADADLNKWVACPYCEAEFIPGLKQSQSNHDKFQQNELEFCKKCGNKVLKDSVVCVYCGCSTCSDMGGITFDKHNARCSRATYVILAILFGGLGIHNFVAGHTNRGVYQILLSLVTIYGGWIWAIIDAITVTHDANGARML